MGQSSEETGKETEREDALVRKKTKTGKVNVVP